ACEELRVRLEDHVVNERDPGVAYVRPGRSEVLIDHRIQPDAIGHAWHHEDVGQLVVSSPDVVAALFRDVRRNGFTTGAPVEKEMQLVALGDIGKASHEIGDDAPSARRPVEQPLRFDPDLHRDGAGRSEYRAMPHARMRPTPNAATAI